MRSHNPTPPRVGCYTGSMETEHRHAQEMKAEHKQSALNRLKTIDRVVLTLSYFLDMTEAEAAETLGIKRGAVKKRKHTALRRLRALVERDFPGLRDSVLEQLEPEWASE